ncbi:MAG TPA: hypothetical protein EYM96_11800 [Rhodospirillales bacterium]|nr:hypothetical protein [Rhodospirillales bacterium]
MDFFKKKVNVNPDSQVNDLSVSTNANDLEIFDSVDDHWIMSGFIDKKYFMDKMGISVIKASLHQNPPCAIAVYSSGLRPRAYYIHEDLPKRSIDNYFKHERVVATIQQYDKFEKTIADWDVNGNLFFVYSLVEKKWFKATKDQLIGVLENGDLRFAVAALSSDFKIVGSFAHPDLSGLDLKKSLDEMLSALTGLTIVLEGADCGVLGELF